MTRGRGGCSFESLRPPVTSGPVIARIPSKPCHIWDVAGLHAFKTLSHLGVLFTIRPSKPCHIWAASVFLTFKTLSHLGSRSSTNLQNPVTSGYWDFRDLQNPVTSGSLLCNGPSKPCHIWVKVQVEAFKTLSHLGRPEVALLQNPVTSGIELVSLSFKTLSHLGWNWLSVLQNPVTSGTMTARFLQNPVTSGCEAKRSPSKPCHIWVLWKKMPFKTLSHLGDNVDSVLQNPVTSGSKRYGRTFKTLSHLGDYHKSFVVQRKFGVKSM